MKEEEIPTIFLGGRKSVLERMGINGNWSIVKAVLAIALVLASVSLLVFRDAVFTIRESGVSASELQGLKTQNEKDRAEFVRKDAIEPRLLGIERNQSEMREDMRDIRNEQTETNKLLRELIVAERRGK